MGKRLTIAFSLLCAASALALDIVKDGKAVAEIFLAKDANRSQQLAAEDLQQFFEQISGAKVAINDKPGGNVKNVIYVGENEYTRKLGFELDAVKNGGYRLLVSGDYAIVAGRDRLGKINSLRKRDPQSTKEWREFAGEAFDVPSAAMAPKDEQCALGIFKNDDTGTWYAAAELLEQLGVRFYHPYENGTVIPQAKDLALEKQDLVRIPRALYREYYAHHTRHCADFQKWMHRNRYGASTVIYDNHTTVEILSDDIRAEYPQVLARDKDGIPYDGRGRGVPKLTDPKFRELSIKFLRAVFRFNPDIAAMALGMPDGMSNIDYEDSIAFRVAEKEHRSRFSDYVWDYWSWTAAELKKTHPDKYLTCLAYAGYSAPPSDPRVVPANAFITYCYSTMQLLEEHTAGPILEKRRKWIEILGKNRMRTWDYIFYGRQRPPLPMYFFELLQKDIQSLDGIYLGKFIEGESDVAKKRMKYPGLMHFTIYWHGRLFWNAREDRAKVMAEYFRLYFGPAEKEMKEFYEFAEHHFTRPDPARRLNAKLLQEHNEKYFEMLARARRKAGKDTVYDKRIAEIETEMTPVKTMHESLLRRGEEIKIATVGNNINLDGSLDKYGPKRYFKDLATGEEIACNPTRAAAAISENKSTLYVIVECSESNMADLKARCQKDDDYNIFDDDVVEVYVETPEAKYFKIVVNSNGAIYDETTDYKIIERETLPLFWESGAKKNIIKTDKSWIVELAIPARDFGKIGPTREFPWGMQIGRTRHARGRTENQALCPTGGGFNLTAKWANIWSQ